jgi:BRCT domain type II-containing protein/nucleoside-triphosphatase THEP1
MDIRNFFGGGGKKTPASSKEKTAPTTNSTDTKIESENDDKTRNETKSSETASAAAIVAEKDDSKKTKKPLTMEQKRKMLLESSDDESVEVNRAAKTSPTKSLLSKSKKHAGKMSDDSVDKTSPLSPRKTAKEEKESSPVRTSPRKRKGASPNYTNGKAKEEKKRKIYDSSDDEDFRAEERKDDDYEMEDIKPKLDTKRTKKSLTSPSKNTGKKAKVEEPTIPKYHPPSSRITTAIPFLKDDPSIVIQPPIKLPIKMKTLTEAFNVDNMASLCLEGLTFVFSGILTTNSAKSAAANTAVAMGSPSKGDYYANRNAYTTSTMTGVGSDEELPRDIATDIVKMLGGRVTGNVSGKTDYLVVGSVLEDGRQVEEGSKFRKCLEMYETWSTKYRNDYIRGDKTKSKPNGPDPNSLVEIIMGVDEFWGLITFMSERKKGTLPEEERVKLEASQLVGKNEMTVECAQLAVANSAPIVQNPYANQKKPLNPYSKAPSNPYATASAPSNPYSKAKTSPGNPYATKTISATTLASNTAQSTASIKPAKAQINALWADKYAPSNSREILGNGDSVNKLFNWLRNWEHQFNDPKKKPKSISGPNGPWKAALLSGPPGIGKTTTATLVAQESNRDVIELNASDARSKKALTEALGDLSGTHAFNFGNTDVSKQNGTAKKRCIIMDEVDGMGAGDRSGISELIQMIKKAKVPIICICNDRSSQKIRSLVQYCMDLRYRRPTKNIIAKRAVEVGRLEGMTV